MRIVIPNQPSGTNLIIKARSKSGAEYSEWSRNFMLTTAGDTIAPNTPANVVGSMAGDSFILSWDAVTLSSDGTPASDLARYEVYVTSSGSIQTATFSTTATKFELPYNQNIAIFGTAQNNVQMAVRAVDRAGNPSAYSATVSQTNAAPAAPTGLTGSAGVDSLDFSWTGVTDADLTGYRLYMGTTVGSQPTRIWSGNSTRVTIQSTDYSTNRYYKVVAVDVFGTESATSNVVGPLKPTSPVTVDITAPAIPTGLAAILTNSTDGLTASAAVSWNTVSDSDLDSYVLAFRQFASPVNDWQYMNVDRTLTSTTIQGLVPYKNYDFRIRTKDFSANYSNWSTIYAATAVSNTAPAVPTGLDVVAGKDNLQIVWNENAEVDMINNAGTYDVTVATNSGFTTGVLQYRTGNTTLAVNGLATNTQYWVRVRAVDSAGLPSAYSASDTATTSNFPVTSLSDGNVPTGAPTLTASAGLGYIYLNWTVVSNADPVIYDVYMSTTNGFTTYDATTKITEVSGTSAFIDTTVAGASLAYGTTYYFKVRARDRDGSSTSISSQASAAPLRVLAADSSLTAGDVGATTPTQVALAVNRINNPARTGTTANWAIITGATTASLTVEDKDFFGITTKAFKVSSNTDTQVASDYFDVDITKAYEVRFWVQDPTGAPSGLALQFYLGLNVVNPALTNQNLLTITPATGAIGAAQGNPYFYQTASETAAGDWREHVAYVFPYGALPEEMAGLGKNALSHFQFTQQIAKMRLRFLNWSNAGTNRDIWATNISVTEMSLSDLRSATLLENWRKPGTITMEGGKIAADTVDADRIKTNSTFTQTLNVKSKFTLGDATTAGIIESYNYSGTTAGFSLSSAGLVINTGTIDARAMRANSAFINELFIGSGGAIQSTGYVAGTTGFKLSTAGLAIEGAGNTVSASVLKGGTVTATTLTIGAGGVIVIDSTAALRSNNYAIGATGYRLDATGLEVNDGTIDAKVLKTNSAVIGDLVIGRSADSLGTMRSFDYVAGTTGWKIGKNFFEINQGTIRAASLQLQDSHNFMPPEYASFEFAPAFYATGAGHLTASGNNTASIVTSGAKYGTQAIRFTANSANSNFNYFGSGSADYMIPLEEGQTYILSGYVRGSGPEPFNFSIRIRGNGDGSYLVAPTVTMSTAWQRVSAQFTVPTGVGHTAGLLVNRIDFTASGQWIELDGIQLERKIANLSTPSPWRPPGMTSADGGIIRTGEIRSNTNVTVNGVTQPAWSVNMSGGAQFGDASIRGKLVVGPTTPTEFATNGNMESTSLAAFTLYANAFMSTTSMVRTTTVGEVVTGAGSLKFTGTDSTSSQSAMGFEVALGSGIPDSNSINFTFNLRYLSTTTVDEQCYALVQLLDSGGVVIKSKPVVFTDNTNFIVQGGTKTASQAITVPSGYTAAKMRIVAQPRIAGTHRFIFDDISINASADLGASSVSSGNYISGGAGWKLNSSGVGEFNDITIRGIIGTAPAGKRLVLGDKFDTGGLYLYSGNAYEWNNGFLNVGDDASVTLWSGYIGNTVPSTPTGSGAGGAGGMGSSYSMGYMRIGPTTGNPTEYGFDFGFARTFLIDATTGFAVSAGSGNFYISDTALASTNVTSAGTLLQGTDAGPMDITQDAQTMTLKWTNASSSAVENKVILNTNGVTLNGSAIVLQNDWTPTAALANLKGNVADQMMWMTRALGVPGMTGGGQIDIDSTYRITWSQRFIAISLGRGTTMGTSGYFDITMPASGTFIPGYGGAADQTTTSAGIFLGAFQALYYEIPFGSAAASQSGNFKVVSYTSDFTVPNNWIMIALRNGDTPSMVYFANGFGATPWIDMTLLNSWAVFDAAGTGHRQPQYRKLNTGDVQVRGLIKHATTTTTGTVFTLPAGYRPAETEMFLCNANTGAARVDVTSAGSISLNNYVASGTGAFVSLAPIKFTADL